MESNKIKNSEKFFNLFCQELNPDVELEDIIERSINSNKRLTWRCNIHNVCNKHIWQGYISNIIGKDSGCPYCSGRIACDCNSIMNNETFAKEFAYDLNTGIDPYCVPIGSRKKIYWRCLDHKSCSEHVWLARVDSRNGSQENKCPFCSHRQGRTCKCDSFLSNQLLEKEFDKKKNKGIDPLKISRRSGIKLWWKCSTCVHSWQATVDKRNDPNNPRACPGCFKKTERKLLSFLENNFLKERYQIKTEHIEEWCKENREKNPYRYDFLISDGLSKVIVELDGNFHFKQVLNWCSPEECKKKDFYKMKMAIDNKIHFIRIFQEDVWNNKNSWEEKLLKKIHKCFKSQNKTKIYYISSNNCYDEMKKLIKEHLKEEEINNQINIENLSI